MSNPFEDSAVVHVYTRKEAIEDGTLTPVELNLAALAGFQLPVAIAFYLKAMLDREVACDRVPPMVPGVADVTDLERVVLDMLIACSRVLFAATNEQRQGNRLVFPYRGQEVIMHIGPDDEGTPVFTFMLSEDD